MPRPGPRPYVCERRAWHSDRHQPMRGSLIREIFRVVNEIHSSATKKNKEWQEKLPVVVLKAEEIMYSKANSEAEYMDLKTLWDRTNDAINTIIRRDESTETGELLQPCIEAALNLGCTPRRTLRSQRNSNPSYYLNTGTQEAEQTSNLGNQTINSLFIASYSNFLKPTTTNVTHLSSETQKSISQNNDCITNKFVFASGNAPLSGNAQILPIETKYPASNLYSVYPLYYGNPLEFEPHQDGFRILPETTFIKVESAKMGVTQNVSSHDVDASNKTTQTDVRDIPENPHETACDLSLRLGPLSVPCSSVGNGQLQEIENIGSTSQEGNKFSDLTPPFHKNSSLFSRSSGDDPLNSRLKKLGVQGDCITVDETMRKRKTVFGPSEDQQFCWQQKLPFSHLTGGMKSAGS